jgi:hypothetical protein
MKRFFVSLSLLFISMLSTGCGSQDAEKTPAGKKLPVPVSGVMMAENRKHPLAKYLELVGFRLTEKPGGKLSVQFGVVNHSDADIADLALDVALKPITAKADEAPFCTFQVKVASLGPRGIADTAGECPTKLRIYELPDWQFIHATFQITAPAP